MIEFVKGNILDSTAQTLVCPVNCVGIMGAGLAKQFKKRFPLIESRYKFVCALEQLRPGRVLINKKQEPWVLLFVTKRHWREESRIEYIEMGLETLVKEYEDLGIKSIAFPKLGCGLGKLNWSEIRPIMISQLETVKIPIFIYD